MEETKKKYFGDSPEHENHVINSSLIIIDGM